MVYYVKQGQNSIFKSIKINGNQCTIQKLTPNTTVKKIEKIAEKMKKKQIEQVILNKETKQSEQFIKILNNYDITIHDGKWLMQYILQDIIDFLKLKGKLPRTDEISILANDLTSEVRQNIKTFASTNKKIRIVTNHLERFKRLEEELYNESGISIIITNNKRKALSKATLIINFDFVQEIVNQYNIGENAIIINLNDQIKINKKRFSGTIITDYEVEIPNVHGESEVEDFALAEILEKQKEYSLKEILEEKIYSNIGESLHINTFRTIENAIKKYNINIKELYGINGVIS